jgi:phospholipid/cholesterol/gamma-HCH transport system ATP-binding protein
MAGKINRLIREVITELRATALTITHDVTTVQSVADDVAFLHGGTVRWTGTVDALNTATDLTLRAFLKGEEPPK